MKKLEVQNFLQSGHSLSDLTKNFHIDIKFHKFYPELCLLKYNQIESPMNEQIVQECRGLILNTNNNYKIVNYTFNKFFNFGELNAKTIDWNSAKVGHKYDGSLIQVYYYNNQWNIATSGVPDGENFVGDFGISFKDLFLNTLKENNIFLPEKNKYNYCFAVELCTPFNKIVVKHEKSYVKLLAARNLESLEEVPRDELKNIWNIPIFEIFNFNSIDEINKSFKDISPVQQEGFVVVDNNFNRIKIKHPGYIALHHIKSSVSLNNFVEIIKNGEIDEIISYFPEYKDSLIKIKTKIDDLIYSTEKFWEKCKHIENRKEFAFYVAKHPISGALFSLRDGKVSSIKEFIYKLDNNKILNLIGEK